MSLQSKLEYLSETKTAIKNALIAKNATISDSTPFRTYADIISGLSLGSNTPSGQDPVYIEPKEYRRTYRPTSWLPIPNIAQDKTTATKDYIVGLYRWTREEFEFFCKTNTPCISVNVEVNTGGNASCKLFTGWGDNGSMTQTLSDNRDFGITAYPIYSSASDNNISYEDSCFKYIPKMSDIGTLVKESSDECIEVGIWIEGYKIIGYYHNLVTVNNCSKQMNNLVDILIDLPTDHNRVSKICFHNSTEISLYPYISSSHYSNKCNTLKFIHLANSYYGNSAFRYCISAEAILTSNVTGALDFAWCTSLKSAPTVNFDTSYSYLFCGCHSLEITPPVEFKTTTSYYFLHMFSYCYNLKKITINFTNASNTCTSYMFNCCYNLEEFPSLNTANVTDMSYMYCSCYKLNKLPNINMSNATNVQYMFKECNNLRFLDMSKYSWKKSVSSCSNIFYGYNPDVIYVSENNGSADIVDKNKSALTSMIIYISNINVHPDQDESNIYSFNYKGLLPDNINNNGDWYLSTPEVASQDITNTMTTEETYPWTYDESIGIWESGGKAVSGVLSKVSVSISGAYSVSFDWRSNGENGYDYLAYDIKDVSSGQYLSGNSTLAKEKGLANLKGKNSITFNSVTYVLPSAGEYTLEFVYGKDGATDSNEDAGFVKNVCINVPTGKYTMSKVSNFDKLKENSDIYWIDD